MSNKLTLRKEFLRFCKTTTLRGVPRIVNAPNRGIRTLWLTFVLSLFFGLFICMFYLARQYLEYDVIHPPRVLRDTASPFPSMTLCNLRPISPPGMELIMNKMLRDPRGYAGNLNKFAARQYFYKNLTMEYQLVSSAISMGGYLESLPKGIAYQLGHQVNDTIIQCRVLYLEGSSRVTTPCVQIGTWRPFSHAMYLNCHSYDIDPEFSNSVLTIELFAYLNQPSGEVNCHDCFASEIKSQLSGAVVVVHNAKTYPDVNQEGINLQPGTLTEIKIKTVENKQKMPPYGRCTPDTPKEIPSHDNSSYVYSEYGCRMFTIQAEINKQCNCNAIEFPYVKENLPFCMTLPAFVDEKNCVYEDLEGEWDSPSAQLLACQQQIDRAKDHLSCKSSVMQHFQSDVVPTCNLPCSFYSYETDRSTSSWPTKSWQLLWLNSTLGRTVFQKPEMSEYRRAEAILRADRTKQGEVHDILNRNNELERNLLAIMILRPNFNLHVVEEKEVLSLTSFLSQSGGLFSIWIGLTMICVVEVIELFVNWSLLCTGLKTTNKYDNGTVNGGEETVALQTAEVEYTDGKNEPKAQFVSVT